MYNYFSQYLVPEIEFVCSFALETTRLQERINMFMHFALAGKYSVESLITDTSAALV